MSRQIPFQRGMNFGFAAGRGWYGSAEGLAQIDRMKALGIDWVAAHVTYVQETWHSTRVFMDFEHTPGDREVLTWIRAAHDAGLKVMLKPILEPLDGTWRGIVDPPRGSNSVFAKLTPTHDYQTPWVKSFQACLAHYVSLAAEAEVDCLCLGAEYWKLEPYTFMWEAIVADARARYPGLLTYEFTPHGLKDRQLRPEIGSWWRQLDFLGFSVYGNNRLAEAPVEDFMEGLQDAKSMAAGVAEEFGLPLALLETGRRSTRGLEGGAWDYSAPGVFDGDIQARYYEAALRTFWDQPWFRGVYWWKWDEHQAEHRPQYYTDPAGDQGFTIAGKPAADVLRQWYAKER